jgi:hypothetical protein
MAAVWVFGVAVAGLVATRSAFHPVWVAIAFTAVRGVCWIQRTSRRIDLRHRGARLLSGFDSEIKHPAGTKRHPRLPQAHPQRSSAAPRDNVKISVY